MALPSAQPKPADTLAAHYQHLLTCPEMIDTRDHLPLFHSLPGRVLEIGCDCGNSTTAFLAGAADSVTSIDINPLCAENFPDSPKWSFILGDSRQKETYNKVCNQQFDVLYVDGDHTYDGAMSDLLRYSQLVRPGGLVLIHDVLATDNFPGVWLAFSCFRGIHPLAVPFSAKYIRPGSYGLGVIEI
jgi:hypothetical protein